MRILGIDPGCIVTGYGIVEESRGRLRHVDNGGIFPEAKASFSSRICFIHDRVESLLRQFSPDAVALENIFVAKNVQSTLKLGHARGAAMVAAGRAQVEIFEYTALQVKQAVTGYGHAGKEQIQKMIQALLGLPGPAFTDASDALAVAVCHSHSRRLQQRLKAG